MTIVEFVPSPLEPRVDLGPEGARRDVLSTEHALNEIADKLRWVRVGSPFNGYKKLVDLAAHNGAYEVLFLLRELKQAMKTDDLTSQVALLDRVRRQVDADIDYVANMYDPTGQQEF